MPQDNKKIAINTLFLYLRKAISLVISLYTSRIVLEMLGVTEFGIYGLVGSIVAIFSVLRGLFASSIQRYINISKGSDSEGDVGKIFSIGLKIHLWISVCFFVVVEIAGWLLIPYLNIPTGNYSVAQWVLLFSILSAVITILTVPYDALIIANEKFKAYAVISLVEYVLRLGIVFLLVFSPFSRVAFYSIMVFVVSLIVRVINTIYCHRKFGDEAKYRNVSDRGLFIEMTRFAGWQFFGNLGYTVTNNGVNFIINIFGGVAVNAARTIAYQVMQSVQQFIGDINVSFQPQSMMLFAKHQKDDFLRLLILNSKATISIAVILSFPILMLTSPILHLWLGAVPDYTVSFVQCILLYLVIRSVHGPIDLLFKCDGRLKRYQLTECFIMTANLPITWLGLKLGLPYYSAFIIMGAVELINAIAILFIAKKQLEFNVAYYSRKVIWPSVGACIFLTSLFAISRIYDIINDSVSIPCLIVALFVLVCIASLTVLMFIFNSSERIKLKKLIFKK